MKLLKTKKKLWLTKELLNQKKKNKENWKKLKQRKKLNQKRKKSLMKVNFKLIMKILENSLLNQFKKKC